MSLPNTPKTNLFGTIIFVQNEQPLSFGELAWYKGHHKGRHAKCRLKPHYFIRVPHDFLPLGTSVNYNEILGLIVTSSPDHSKWRIQEANPGIDTTEKHRVLFQASGPDSNGINWTPVEWRKPSFLGLEPEALLKRNILYHPHDERARLDDESWSRLQSHIRDLRERERRDSNSTDEDSGEKPDEDPQDKSRKSQGGRRNRMDDSTGKGDARGEEAKEHHTKTWSSLFNTMLELIHLYLIVAGILSRKEPSGTQESEQSEELRKYCAVDVVLRDDIEMEDFLSGLELEFEKLEIDENH